MFPMSHRGQSDIPVKRKKIIKSSCPKLWWKRTCWGVKSDPASFQSKQVYKVYPVVWGDGNLDGRSKTALIWCL